MKKQPIVLTIAGSDCSGGAGIQADIKTITSLGAYAASVITAVTIQNTMGVKNVYNLPVDVVKDQLEAVMEDLEPAVIKIGMISEPDIARCIAQCLATYKPGFVVYDPVMVSTSGKQLMSNETIDCIKSELFPHITLLTPNLNEAEVLTDEKITDMDGMMDAAGSLSLKYHMNVLVKGGHLAGDEMTDILYTTSNKISVFTEKKIETSNLHGTGCTLSSAIASRISIGMPLDKAVESAKHYVSKAIEAAAHFTIGKGNGPLCHNFEPENMHTMNKE